MGEEFSDAEFAFLRHVRFGELPSGVRPEDAVPLTETDPPRGADESIPQLPPHLTVAG